MCLTRKVLGLAVVLAALSGVVPAFAQTGGLTGTAKDENGAPMVGYPVLIDRLDIKGSYKTKTNKKGEYIYIGLPIGNYKVTLTTATGQTVDFVGQIHLGMGDPTTLDFDMAKVKAQRAKEQTVNPEFQKKLEEQKKEEKQFGGLKDTFDQGQALSNEKKYAEAASVYEQALALAKEKNIPIVLGRLADTYHKARQYDKAIETYQKAMALRPQDATLHNNLGNVYAEMGKVTEAQAEFKKAAELDPTGASRYYFNMGAVMYNQGKMDEAMEAFKKATDIDPNFADAFFMQGRALMGKATMTADGKVVAAPGTVEALQSYLKLDPNGKYATEAQAMLQTVQGGVQTEYKSQKKKKG